VTARDPARDAVLATNAYNEDFPGRTAFLARSAPRSTTSDRLEVLGRFGSPRQPARSHETSRRSTGAGLECAALEVEINSPAKSARSRSAGSGPRPRRSDALLARYADPPP
jgi:cellobiose phosphorylase